MSETARHTIVLAPVGDLQPALLDRICKDITRIFNFQTRIETLLADVSFAYDSSRDQLGGKASVISTLRLGEGISEMRIDDTFGDRVAKEAIHELGHTFNLRHCKDENCIMHYCRNEHDVDRKSDQLCRYCRIMLEDEVKRIEHGA